MVDGLTTEFSDKGLLVIAVDVGESKKVVQQYLKDHPRKCQVVMTGDTNLAAMYAANRYPIYVVVDREGQDRRYKTRRWRREVAAPLAGSRWSDFLNAVIY
jgi:hypothetical protein